MNDREPREPRVPSPEPRAPSLASPESRAPSPEDRGPSGVDKILTARRFSLACNNLIQQDPESLQPVPETPVTRSGKKAISWNAMEVKTERSLIKLVIESNEYRRNIRLNQAEFS